MARRKQRMAYITNNSARKTTFKKRKNSMMKKLRELSTLCGIEACAIIYSPFDFEPEVWPSSYAVENALKKLKDIPAIEKSRKMLSQESYLKGTISKAYTKLKRVRRENREKELRAVMFQSLTKGIPQFQNLNLMDMDDLGRLINQKLNEIDNKKKSLSEEVDRKSEPDCPTYSNSEHGESKSSPNMRFDGDEAIPFGDPHHNNVVLVSSLQFL